MSALAYGPQNPVTAQQVDEWMSVMHQKRRALHPLLQEPLYSTRRDQAVIALGTLLQEALEEVHVLSASLREESQALRARAAALREHSTALTTRPIPVVAQFLRPTEAPSQVPVMPPAEAFVTRMCTEHNRPVRDR